MENINGNILHDCKKQLCESLLEILFNILEISTLLFSVEQNKKMIAVTRSFAFYIVDRYICSKTIGKTENCLCLQLMTQALGLTSWTVVVVSWASLSSWADTA